jgi:hypothetical protein
MLYIHSAGLYVKYWCTQAYSMQEDIVHPLTLRKYIVLNGDFLLDLCNFDMCDYFRNITIV